MASFLCQVQTIQRAAGRSAVAAAAYRSGAALVDERLAMEFDFANKDGIEHAEIMAPEAAPAALKDREGLWNAAEAAETRRDGVPARELLVALPHELDFEQRRELVRAFVQEHLVAKGMIADIAMHRPGKEGDQRNFHAHILVTTRCVGPKGFGLKDRSWRTPEQVREWRAGWAKTQNEHLRRHLGPNAPQVSHLSLAERGVDRAPTVHMGPAATALERKNIASERGEQNRDVRARNRKVREVHVALEETIDKLAAREPIIQVPVPKLVTDAGKVRDDLVAQRDQWVGERDALTAPKVLTERQVERELTAEAAVALKGAQARLRHTEQRVKKTREKRLRLVQWIRNPARMIWAKHAELNALAKARAEVRRHEVALQVRQAWARSDAGQAFIAARRQPSVTVAAEVARQRRTLERKIKRMDKRIVTATRTYNDLRVAHELGQAALNVPRTSPDATRFVRDVGAPARAAIQAYPAQARQLAVERLNRGQGRSIGRNLFPGR
ncbi:MAG: MobA/MobL family protein [Phenylobacterium sp.]|uniref:MobQ family relaxase n=1 Tax=Phenylobacterium sp. TaxID=1871053 RepID=UPI0025DC8E87|nr:MobQ family relaxase [Phenylobacterium sp.]MBT9470862.1 MobA/MobL family protein [Phenylobacterium sp.]